MTRWSEAMIPPVPRGVTPSRWVWLRYNLANRWRTYLYAGLELGRLGNPDRPHAWRLTHVYQESPQSGPLMWAPVGSSFATLREIAAREGIKLGVAVFQDGFLEGIPALTIRALLKESGLPWLDLAPLWGSLEHFVTRYTLGWDGHPSPKANRMAAGALAKWIEAEGWMGEEARKSAQGWMEGHRALTDAYLKAQEQVAARQRQEAKALQARFSSTLTSRTPPGMGGPADGQWLYGWSAQGMSPTRNGMAMEGTAGFRLKAPEAGARTLRVVGTETGREGDVPIRLEARCDGASIGAVTLPVGGPFSQDFALASPLAAGAIADCLLLSSGGTPRSSGGPPPPGQSVQQVLISSLSLEP